MTTIKNVNAAHKDLVIKLRKLDVEFSIKDLLDKVRPLVKAGKLDEAIEDMENTLHKHNCEVTGYRGWRKERLRRY
jgi:hypothetical protein